MTTRPRPRFRPKALGALLLACWLAACTSDQSALSPLSPSGGEIAPRSAALRQAVDREHLRLMAAFGGEYRAPRVKAALEEIVARLARAGEGQIGNYEITLLNSPVVNAFALPNGRLYATRGLLVLGNDDAEIASVLAHEIAHVTDRHAVERAELELESALVSRVVADVLKDPTAGAAVAAGSKLSLARFSRQQELAADQISVRNIARAGYDPYGAGRFLAALGRNTALRNAMQGQTATEKRLDILSTHPSTPERTAAVTAAARQIGAPGLGRRDRTGWLQAVEGLAFGEDPADGVVRGRRYLNSTLRIAFEAPAGFELEAARDMVVGVSADGAQALRFDSVALKPGQTLESYVASGWIEGVTTGAVEPVSANGLRGVVTSGQGTDWRFRLAAVQAGDRVYRFIVAARGRSDPERAMRAALESFRTLGAAEAQTVQPLRVRLVVAQAGDTAEGLAGRMAVRERPLDLFLVLNGLERGAALQPGERYKIVAE